MMNTWDKAEEFKGDQNEETEKLTLIFNGEVRHWWKTRTKKADQDHLGLSRCF